MLELSKVDPPPLSGRTPDRERQLEHPTELEVERREESLALVEGTVRSGST